MFNLKLVIFLKNTFKTEIVDNKFYYVINIFGLKLKFRDKEKEQARINQMVVEMNSKVSNLENENKLLRILLERSVDITKVPPATGDLRKEQLVKTKLLELVSIVLKQNNIAFWLNYGTLIGAIRHKGFIPWDDDIDVAVMKEDYFKIPKALKVLEELNPKFYVSYNFESAQLLRFFYKEKQMYKNAGGYCIDFFPFEYTDKEYVTKSQRESFIENWYKIKRQSMSKYSDDLLIRHVLSFADMLKIEDYNSQVRNKIFGYEYKENICSNQLVYSPVAHFVSEQCAILSKNNIFPLKTCQFENLVLPIPNNPIAYLFEHGIYGDYGAVMNFPKLTDNGFLHTQPNYKDGEVEHDRNLKELTQFVEDYKKNLV